MREHLATLDTTDAGAFVDHASTDTLRGRTEWRRLLELACRRQVDLIVVWKLDRAFRSVLDGASTLQMLTACGCGLRSPQEPWIDTTTAIGEAMYHTTLAWAQPEKRPRSANAATRAAACSMDLGASRRRRMQTATVPASVVPPGAGQRWWLLGDTYTLKLSAEQTGGAFALLEATVPPGGGPPPHAHDAEQETFVILAGELAVTTEAGTIAAPAGTVVHVPQGTRHSYATVGTTPVRMLFLYVPAGMERMFAEIGTPAQPGLAAPPPSEADVAKLVSVADRFHFRLLPPAPPAGREARA